jgi:hypothetical protein
MKPLTVFLMTFAVASGQAFAGTNTLDAKLDNKLKNETSITDRLDLDVEITKEFREVSGLDEMTVEKLRTLRTQTLEKERQFEIQNLRLRAVLAKDLLEDEYNQREVALIKKRMHTISNRRIDLLFAAVSEAHKILGEQAKRHKEIFDEYFRANLAAQP